MSASSASLETSESTLKGNEVRVTDLIANKVYYVVQYESNGRDIAREGLAKVVEVSKIDGGAEQNSSPNIDVQYRFLDGNEGVMQNNAYVTFYEVDFPEK